MTDQPTDHINSALRQLIAELQRYWRRGDGTGVIDFFRQMPGGRFEVTQDGVRWGWDWGAIMLDGVDPSTFHPLTDDGLYGADVHSVYLGAGRIPDADPASFQVLGHGFAADRSAVFNGHKRLAGIRSAGFEILDVSTYWQVVRDQEAAYYVSYGKVRRIDSRHPDRLRIVPSETYPDQPTRFQTDGDMVFVDGLTVPEADPKRFRALGHNFGADARHVFHGRQIILEADPSSARVLRRDFLRDDRSLFYGNARVPDSDPDSFAFLSDNYGRDRGNAYCFLWPPGGKPHVHVLRTKDPSKFRVIDGAGLAGDGTHFYRWGEAIPVSQPAAFHKLGNGYTSDGAQVFYSRKVVGSADPASFHVLHNAYATDRLRPYNCGKAETYTEAILGGLAQRFYESHPVLADHWYFTAPALVALRRLSEGGWRGEFSSLGYGFARIDDLVFIHGIPYLDARPEDLDILGPQLWRDQAGLHRVFVWTPTIGDDGEPLRHRRVRVTGTFLPYETVDAASFALFPGTELVSSSDSGYARDRRWIFYCTPSYSGWRLIRRLRADYPTFRVIAGDLGTDRASVFYGGAVVAGADPSDVDAFGLQRPQYFRSGGTVFFAGKRLRAKGVDHASFRMLLSHLAVDAHHAYFSNGGVMQRLAGIDPASVSRDDAGGLHFRQHVFAGDAVDRLLWRYRERAFQHLDELEAAACAVEPTYRIGEDTVWFGPIALEGADPCSFQPLGFGYGRDARAVWFGHERIACNYR